MKLQLSDTGQAQVQYFDFLSQKSDFWLALQVTILTGNLRLPSTNEAQHYNNKKLY